MRDCGATVVLRCVVEHGMTVMERVLHEHYGKRKRRLYICFVVLEKAFDRVPKKVIEWALKKRSKLHKS